MTGPPREARVILGLALISLALPIAAAPATVNKVELAHCAAIAASDERLACYDALAGRGPTQVQPAPAEAKSHAAPADTKSFGLTKPAPQVTPAGPELIKARVVKVTASQFGAVNVLLDNGQTWALNEPNEQLAAGDAVTIKRAALGSFLMSTPAKKSYRVRRMQ
jgi:hypothetical protein